MACYCWEQNLAVQHSGSQVATSVAPPPFPPPQAVSIAINLALPIVFFMIGEEGGGGARRDTLSRVQHALRLQLWAEAAAGSLPGLPAGIMFFLLSAGTTRKDVGKVRRQRAGGLWPPVQDRSLAGWAGRCRIQSLVCPGPACPRLTPAMTALHAASLQAAGWWGIITSVSALRSGHTMRSCLSELRSQAAAMVLAPGLLPFVHAGARARLACVHCAAVPAVLRPAGATRRPLPSTSAWPCCLRTCGVARSAEGGAHGRAEA